MSAATWLAESSNSDWVDLASAVSRLGGDGVGHRLLLIEVARRDNGWPGRFLSRCRRYESCLIGPGGGCLFGRRARGGKKHKACSTSPMYEPPSSHLVDHSAAVKNLILEQ
jgi:hypothetical protein